jgi:hypothetical protein
VISGNLAKNSSMLWRYRKKGYYILDSTVVFLVLLYLILYLGLLGSPSDFLFGEESRMGYFVVYFF